MYEVHVPQGLAHQLNYICVCIHVCVCESRHVQALASVWRSEDNFRFSVVWDKVSCSPLHMPEQPINFCGFSCRYRSTGITAIPSRTWVLEIKTQIRMLTKHLLWLPGHLLSHSVLSFKILLRLSDWDITNAWLKSSCWVSGASL